MDSLISAFTSHSPSVSGPLRQSFYFVYTMPKDKAKRSATGDPKRRRGRAAHRQESELLVEWPFAANLKHGHFSSLDEQLAEGGGGGATKRGRGGEGDTYTHAFSRL